MPSFAVAAGHDLTADAAADVLLDGGTAVDAVIAAGMMAMVAEPVLAGLLGGGFLMVRTPEGQSHLLDFFVQTPRRKVSEGELAIEEVYADFGTTTQAFHIGEGTVAVPGVAPGLAEAHARFGRMPLPDLAEPARRVAVEGVRLSAYQARLLKIVEPIYKATGSARSLFAPDDELLPEGALYCNPTFADVLDAFSHEGPRFVTEGEVAEALLATTQDGGHLTVDDLRRYAPRWRQPLSIDRHGVRVSLNPPPALGGALIGFGLAAMSYQSDIVETLHTLAVTNRARVDAALDQDPASGARQLLDPDMLARYRNEIRGHAAATRGTTHISVVDQGGMGAALTLSNGEGAGMIVPGTGIMPNNMLGEADLLPDGFHAWTPDQRLSSMMAPLTADWSDGRFMMLGSGGSNRIRSALLQVLAHVIDHGMSLSDAVEAPRIHVEADGAVDFEDLGGDAFREAILTAAPEARAWDDLSMFFGGAHGVMSDPKRGFDSAGDPRRAGVTR
ncbi:MAG: gamma-glutamyltransferase [Pseudomonadota bacterium]